MLPAARPLVNVVLAGAYAAAYMVCYIYFLNYWFDYGGFSLYSRDFSFHATSVVLSVLPAALYRGNRAISSVISVFIYVLLYVPVVLTFGMGSDRSVDEILLIQASFMVCMSLLFLSDLLIIRSPVEVSVRADLVGWSLVGTLVLTAYVVLVYRGNLRFVSFGQAIYEQRFANVDLGSGLATRYLSSWLSNVLVPLCLAYGLVAKDRKYFLAGVTACVVLYMATAAKVMILLPPVYAVAYVTFANGRMKAVFPMFVLGMTIFVGSLVALTKQNGTPLFLASSILLNRTIGNGGQLTMAYYDFFATHPQTSFAHVNGIKQITGAYPYGDQGLGNVVGEYYWSAEMNANANFWATDGIASMGLPGVFIATVICALLFMAMNTATRGYDRLFVVLCFLPFTVQILNTSVFSSVWSGGALFLLLFFLLNTKRADLIRA